MSDENGKDIDYRQFRTSWQHEKGHPRFRVIPLKKYSDGKKTESKLSIPVLYLGLSRLFPIGEAKEESIASKRFRFIDDDEKKWFVDKYRYILSLVDGINEVDDYRIGETERKQGVAIKTDKYDYLTNSSGQDNLGQILMAVLSFKRIYNKAKDSDSWNGGLLLIDEIDATLHPAAQKRLADFLQNESKEIGIQTVVTTHSSDLLKHLCEKVSYNVGEESHPIEIYYFTNANRYLEIRRNIDFFAIQNDLLIQSVVQSNKIKVYSEDPECRWFIEKLISRYMMYVELLDIRIGCDSLLSLYSADINYFGNVIIILDGDVPDKKIKDTLMSKLGNIIKLPGSKRPEQIIYEYIMGLDELHPFWEAARSSDMTWQYFHDNGPTSSQYKQEKEREKYKKWFNDHLPAFNATRIFDYWLNDNKKTADEFVSSFIVAFNKVAERNLMKEIEFE